MKYKINEGPSKTAQQVKVPAAAKRNDVTSGPRERVDSCKLSSILNL